MVTVTSIYYTVLPLVLIILAIVLGIWALIDLYKRPLANKAFWVGAIILSPYAGSLIYLALNRKP